VAGFAKEFNLFPSPVGGKYERSGFPLQKKYRSYFELVALVLESVKSDWATPFPIMRYAGINFTQLKKYVECLVHIGFIEEKANSSRLSYKATERGVEFLSQYYVLLGMLLSGTSHERRIPSQNKKTVSPILQRKF